MLEFTAFTNSQPSIQELHAIIKEMRSNASPGPDGLNAAFYKSAWTWIGKDVHILVTTFYTTAFIRAISTISRALVQARY
jgi:hypothetical protein